ncbi:(d)CMP kinase [Arsenicicoccus dermatophilus]|uniref:(d)CMP kinase n=1 Tax=Arsenicicoccus dermatophilus TaxID=1076331 RepID=UPI001F4C8CCA|nr:(d)CMP kinase [Arsenicicoccus dermatophilus]MCH8613008.1 (d)CMP kinase [Arsenicicoccus dermatophilus]
MTEPNLLPTSPEDQMNGPDLVAVAIDGPSGSGKSTVSRMAAQRLGHGYLDTGAMYRAATWWCLHEGIDLADQARVAEAVRALPLEMGTDPVAPTVHVDGTDVAEAIRTTEIASVVSQVATNLDVRAELRRRQREIIGRVGRRRGGIIAEGRDITTVVAPDADVRILLVASQEARLRRRATELHGQASAESVAATRDQIVRRDRDDSTVSSFMTAAPGVITIDTSDLTLQGSVEAVLDEIASAMGRIRD